MLLAGFAVGLEPQVLGRRAAGSQFVGVAGFLFAGPVSAALEEPKATSLVALELGGGMSDTLEIELYGESAPASVAAFLDLARGTLKAPCSEASEDLSPSRVKSNRRALEYECLDNLGEGVGLLDSLLWRIVPNFRVDMGRVPSRFANREAPAVEPETNNLRHRRGAVSVRRGGKAFEFTLAPRDNPDLDDEPLVVIGQVRNLAVLDALNDIPSKRSPFDSKVPPLGSNFARACEYSAPDPTCAQFKPLRKVYINRVSITDLSK